MAQEARVVELPKKWQGDDQVFFHRSQIKIGARIMNFGRLDHGQIWEVVEIKSYRVNRAGNWTSDKVDVVQKLADDVTIRRLGSNEHRTTSFANLSYSAIWRLA